MRGIILGDYLEYSIIYNLDEYELNLYKRSISENNYFYDTFFEVDFKLKDKNRIDSMGIIRFVDNFEIKNIVEFRKFNLRKNLQKHRPKLLLLDEIIDFVDNDNDIEIIFKSNGTKYNALVVDSNFNKYFKLNKELVFKFICEKTNFAIAIKNSTGDLELLKIHSI